MPTYTSAGPEGDVLPANVMPQAEYMYGCMPTAVAMLLGYYDLYGCRGEDLSGIIGGEVALKSRGTEVPVEPGDFAEHIETWQIEQVRASKDDDELAEQLKPFGL